jgi:hypothetical protein
MGKKSGSGIRIRNEQPFLMGLNKYSNSLMRIRDLGWKNSGSGRKNSGSGIRYKHLGSATLIKKLVWVFRQWRWGGEFPGEPGSGALPGRVPQHPAPPPRQPSHGRRDPCVRPHHPQLLDDQHLLHALDDPSQVP